MPRSPLRSLPALPFPLPFPLRHSPRDVSAARPPQPPQRTLHATQPPIASRCCCCCCFPAQRCHSDSRGIPSSAPPPPRASLGITHCSSSRRDRGKDRATVGDSSRERPVMALWLNTPGREGRAEGARGSGLRANRLSPHPQQFHPCPLSPSHLPTPSIARSQAVLCSSAPRARSFGAVHTSTVMAQSPHRHLCIKVRDQVIDRKLKPSSKPDHQESVGSLPLTTNPQ